LLTVQSGASLSESLTAPTIESCIVWLFRFLFLAFDFFFRNRSRWIFLMLLLLSDDASRRAWPTYRIVRGE
jgi:hypothetical protein